MASGMEKTITSYLTVQIVYNHAKDNTVNKLGRWKRSKAGGHMHSRHPSQADKDIYVDQTCRKHIRERVLSLVGNHVTPFWRPRPSLVATNNNSLLHAGYIRLEVFLENSLN